MSIFTNTSSPFVRQKQAYESAKLLVQLFYVCQFYFLNQGFYEWMGLRERTVVDPLWPVKWMSYAGLLKPVDFAIIFYTLSLIFSSLYSSVRLFRLLNFVGLLLFASLHSGKINHTWHAWIYVSFIFIFLPDEPKKKSNEKRLYRQKYLSVFLAAQASILVIYTLAGFWKYYDAFYQLANGQVNAFSFKGFAYQVADRLMQTNSTSLLGSYIIDHPWLGWLMFQGAMLLELTSIAVLWFPSLQPLWGLSMICMHLGSVLTVSVRFSSNIILLGLLFVSSPFLTKRFKRLGIHFKKVRCTPKIGV